MRLSAFTLTLVFIIILAAVLFYSQWTHDSGIVHSVSPNTSSQAGAAAKQISRMKNITYEYIYSENSKKPEGTAEMIGINAIAVSTGASDVRPGQTFPIYILYKGYFGFNTGNYNSSAFLGNTIDLYYFGYRSPAAKNLLVYNNVANVSKYFTLKNSSMGVPAGLNPVNVLQETVYLEPTLNASGNTWDFCGGLFLAYLNNTHSSGLFGYLSFNGTDVSNSSVLNFVSNDCASVKVS